MLREYFDAGGPLMLAVFAAWVVVFAGILDRIVYAVGCAHRRPRRAALRLARRGEVQLARRTLEDETRRAERGLERIHAVSQLATSIGLFGTVLGIARSFFARGGEIAGDAPEVLATGLSTALFTTLGGLCVFLVGEAFLIAFREWCTFVDRDLEFLRESPRMPLNEAEAAA